MVRIRSLAKGLVVVACMLFLVHCGEIEAPETGETPQASQSAPRARVYCLPPQWGLPALDEFQDPFAAPRQCMLTITDRELIPKIEEAIVARNDEGQVTNVVLTFERDAFVIRGTLQRALRTTIQVSGRLVMRNDRVEAEMVKGRIGFIAVPESYMAEATDEVNESLDTYFRTEYGIRVTSVEILPGELRLSGERLR